MHVVVGSSIGNELVMWTLDVISGTETLQHFVPPLSVSKRGTAQVLPQYSSAMCIDTMAYRKNRNNWASR